MPRVRYGNRGQQGHRVRVQWVSEEFFSFRYFDQLSKIHDCYSVTNVFDGAEVVRDVQVGQTELLLKVSQKVQNLSPNGDV